MFVRTSYSTYKGKRYQHFYLAESYRDPETGKPRQRLLMNLTPLPAHVVESIRHSLKIGQGCGILLRMAAGDTIRGAGLLAIDRACRLSGMDGILAGLSGPETKNAVPVLFNEICRLTVQSGELKMSWIGRLEKGSGLVKPVACYGAGTDYLDAAIISTRQELPEGRGPAGTALRESRPVVAENFPINQCTHPWHNLGSQYGWKASVAIPVQRRGQPYAVFGAYHGESHVFDQTILGFLTEMTRNLGHVLDRIEPAEERRQIEPDFTKSNTFRTD